MSKVASMTIGLVLIFMGAQFFMVKSYLLTPTATSFMAEHFNENSDSQFSSEIGNLASNSPGPSAQSWPYYQSSQSSSAGGVPSRFGSFVNSPPPGYQHRLVPPKWVTWPTLFMGVVFFLHGLALRR